MGNSNSSIKKLIKNMKDKIVLITGATGGIGKQIAISIASLGATVIITGRNLNAGNLALKEIKDISKNNNIDLIIADLSIISDIKNLVEIFNSKYERLDVLINNAGTAEKEYKKTEDGFESNFAVNVVAPFLLSNLFFNKLTNSKKGRIINLTGGDLPSKIHLNNIQSEKSFNGLSTYSQTKMIMMCVMYEFSQRQLKSNVTVNICYPGQASTRMTQNVTAKMLPLLLRPLFPLFKYITRPDNGKSAKKASRSSVFLATSNEVENMTGIYCDKKVKIRKMPNAVTDINNRIYIWNYLYNLTNCNSYLLQFRSF